VSQDAGQESAAIAHARHLVVWGVPGALGRGESFRIRAGIRCEHACTPGEWLLEVSDHAGVVVANALTGSEPEPGTEALYSAELALSAPVAEGRFDWHVRATETPANAPDAFLHAAASARFTVNVVPAANCRVTVVATDRETQQPVVGARVVAHPYRAVTDTAGIASLELPKGSYRLFVSGNGFFPLRVDAVLGDDATICAELEPDVGPSDAEMWP
jgi:hypothetical protein